MNRPYAEEFANAIKNDVSKIVDVIEDYEEKIADLNNTIENLEDQCDNNNYEYQIRELEQEIDERNEDIRILTDQLSDAEYLIEELKVTIKNLSK